MEKEKETLKRSLHVTGCHPKKGKSATKEEKKYPCLTFPTQGKRKPEGHGLFLCRRKKGHNSGRCVKTREKGEICRSKAGCAGFLEGEKREGKRKDHRLWQLSVLEAAKKEKGNGLEAVVLHRRERKRKKGETTISLLATFQFFLSRGSSKKKRNRARCCRRKCSSVFTKKKKGNESADKVQQSFCFTDFGTPKRKNGRTNLRAMGLSSIRWWL